MSSYFDIMPLDDMAFSMGVLQMHYKKYLIMISNFRLEISTLLFAKHIRNFYDISLFFE